MSSSATRPDALGVRAGAVAPLRLRLALAAACVTAIVAEQALGSPLHLPGHRGLIWLTALVAIALTTRQPGWATGVGAASGSLVLIGGIGSHGVVGVAPYVLGGLALDFCLVWLAPLTRTAIGMAALAALIHLVGLIAPASGGGAGTGRGPGSGHGPVALIAGHLAFGAAAGAIGFALARRARGSRSNRRAGPS